MLETALKIGRLVAFSLALIAAGGLAAVDSAKDAQNIAEAARCVATQADV